MIPIILSMNAEPAQDAAAPCQHLPSYVIVQEGNDMYAIERLFREMESARTELRPIPPPFDVLPAHVAAEVAERWTEPCEGVFEYLADKYPGALATLIKDGSLSPADLTYAAEYMGHSPNSAEVRKILLPLLEHPSAVVREGAIYGIRRHLDAGARERLSAMADHDPNSAVMEAATEALEDP